MEEHVFTLRAHRPTESGTSTPQWNVVLEMPTDRTVTQMYLWIFGIPDGRSEPELVGRVAIDLDVECVSNGTFAFQQRWIEVQPVLLSEQDRLKTQRRSIREQLTSYGYGYDYGLFSKADDSLFKMSASTPAKLGMVQIALKSVAAPRAASDSYLFLCCSPPGVGEC